MTSNLSQHTDRAAGASSDLLTSVCRAYADLLRRQRTASSAFVVWQKETRRSHEFAWLAGDYNAEILMRDGRYLRIQRGSVLFDAVQKMHATAELNPYEREILYGYPYVIGRLHGRPVRAPLFTIPVQVLPEGSGFVISPDDDVVRFNTLPFRAEVDTDARALALEALLDKTPPFPLGADGAASAQSAKC